MTGNLGFGKERPPIPKFKGKVMGKERSHEGLPLVSDNRTNSYIAQDKQMPKWVTNEIIKHS